MSAFRWQRLAVFPYAGCLGSGGSQLGSDPVGEDGGQDDDADDDFLQVGIDSSRDRPLFSTPMISRPMKVPPIDPTPPARLAPPITTTAITLSR